MTDNIYSLQILIVDDDLQIRLGLEQIINTHFSQDEISVLSCENGLIASQILEQETIDILITDIKMPFCSGIELLQIVQEKNYSCYSIILSGYDDFSLVRNAMRLGAVDYLLKPVDEELLIHTITDIKQSMVCTPSSVSISPIADVLKKQKILELFMSNPRINTNDLSKYMSENNITTESFCIMCYVDIKRALYSNHLTMFQFLADCVQSTLADFLPHSKYNFHVVYGNYNNFWILLIFSNTNEANPNVILEPFLKMLQNGHLRYSYTSSWYDYNSLSQGDAFCRKGFEKYYYDLPYKTVHMEDPETSLKTHLNLAAEAVSTYNYPDVIQNLELCFSLINYLHPDISELKKLMNHFVYQILTQNTAFIPIISKSKFTDYDILEYIETSESLSILQKNVYFSIQNLIGELIISSKDKDDYVIQKSKEYIHTNYQNNISLNDVASHVFLNSNYFSSLFKQKTGVTFRNYLRDFRIEKAKKLLLSTNLRIYEIGLSVGYNEQSHFIRAFKTVTGVTPTEFRDA